MPKASVTTGATAAANWLAAMQSASTKSKYAAGVNACPVNPMSQAATPAAQQAYAEGTANAVSSGSMAAALNATPKAAWTTGCTTKGVQSLATGAANAQQKVATKFNALQQSWSASNAAAKQAKAQGVTGLAAYTAAYTAQMAALGKPA